MATGDGRSDQTAPTTTAMAIPAPTSANATATASANITAATSAANTPPVTPMGVGFFEPWLMDGIGLISPSKMDPLFNSHDASMFAAMGSTVSPSRTTAGIEAVMLSAAPTSAVVVKTEIKQEDGIAMEQDQAVLSNTLHTAAVSAYGNNSVGSSNNNGHSFPFSSLAPVSEDTPMEGFFNKMEPVEDPRPVRQVLNDLLSSRPSREQLMDHNILRDYNTAPGLHAAQDILHRKKITHTLDRKLGNRPTVQFLQNHNIMKDPSTGATIQVKQEQLRRGQVESQLEDRLMSRQGVIELACKNIYPTVAPVEELARIAGPDLLRPSEQLPVFVNGRAPDVALPSPPTISELFSQRHHAQQQQQQHLLQQQQHQQQQYQQQQQRHQQHHFFHQPQARVYGSNNNMPRAPALHQGHHIMLQARLRGVRKLWPCKSKMPPWPSSSSSRFKTTLMAVRARPASAHTRSPICIAAHPLPPPPTSSSSFKLKANNNNSSSSFCSINNNNSSSSSSSNSRNGGTLISNKFWLSTSIASKSSSSSSICSNRGFNNSRSSFRKGRCKSSRSKCVRSTNTVTAVLSRGVGRRAFFCPLQRRHHSLPQTLCI